MKFDDFIFYFLKINEVIDFFKKNKFFLIYLISISVFSYGFELFNFVLSIDEEVYVYNSETNRWVANAWIGQSRWGMSLLSLLMPDPIFPFTPFFLCLFSSALAFPLIVRIWSNDRCIAEYVAAPIALTFPSLYFLFSFNTLNFGVGIGFLTCALGVWFFLRKTVTSFLCAAVLIAFSIGIYQALISYLLVLYIFHLFANIFLLEKNFSKSEVVDFSKFTLLILSSLIIYQLTAKFFMFYYNVGQSPYLGYFTSFSIENFWHDVWISTSNTLSNMFSYYMGTSHIFIDKIYSLAILTTLCTALIVTKIVSINKVDIKSKIVCLFLFMLALLSPFLLGYINLGNLMPRTMLGIPLALSGIVFFSVKKSKLRLTKILILLMAVLCSINFSIINNRLAFSGYMAWQSDRELASQIISKIHNMDDSLPRKMPYLIEVVGQYNRLETPIYINRDTIGPSFFAWDGGSAGRVVALIATMNGRKDFGVASLKERFTLIDKAVNMPVWPHKNSVDVVNNIVVIKFGNYTAQQINEICSLGKASPLCGSKSFTANFAYLGKMFSLGGICIIDSINGEITNSRAVSKKSPLSVSGWIVNDKNNSVSQTVALKLTGVNRKDIFYAYTSGRLSRPDVAKAINNPAFENAGFNLTSNLDEVPPGSYTLELIQPDADNLLVCPNQGFIEIK